MEPTSLDLTTRADPFAIAEAAAARLRLHSYAALKKVLCRFEDGALILHGYLPSYYLKQLAQQAVVQIEGVRWIDNQIKVLEPG